MSWGRGVYSPTVQTIAKQKGAQNTVVDETVALIDECLEKNRKKPNSPREIT